MYSSKEGKKKQTFAGNSTKMAMGKANIDNTSTQRGEIPLEPGISERFRLARLKTRRKINVSLKERSHRSLKFNLRGLSLD